MKRAIRYRILLTATLAALVVSANASGGRRHNHSDQIAIAHGSDMFPSAELSDWVSYALQVAVMRVTDEQPIPLTAKEKARGEGLIGRTVTLHTERVLWQASGGTLPPTDVVLQATGWFLRNGKQVPFTMDEAPRLEVGESYIVPLTQADGEWTLLAPSTVVPISQGGAASTGEPEAGTAARVRNMTLEALAAELAQTAPDPIAVKYQHLPPYERGRAVTEEKAAADPAIP